MLGDRFLCDNQTRCLNYSLLCDGIDDCLDRTDELICFWDRGRCTVGQFACSHGRGCKNVRCNPDMTCSNKANWFWCLNSTQTAITYRVNKHRRLSNYETFCYSHQAAFVNISSPSSLVLNKAAGAPRPYGFCKRGFFLTRSNDSERLSFCPPSFYGDRCQFDRRRVIVRVRFDRRHRSDLAPVIHVLVLLLLNHSQVIDHQMFADIDQDFPPKHNIYLLYSHSKPQGTYSVRLEAFLSTNLLAGWKYTISPLDFLPALRLNKILRFLDRPLPWISLGNRCRNNGTCVHSNDGQHLCLCQRGWRGVFCEGRIAAIKCALHSLARDEHICICPQRFLQPNRFVRNTACEKAHCCSPGQICYPLSVNSSSHHRCICNTSSCNVHKPIIVLHRRQTNQEPMLLQLLKFSSDYPRIRQNILISSSTIFPIIRAISTLDERRELGSVPEIGLLFTLEPRTRYVGTILSLQYINCTNSLRNYIVDLDSQPQRCRPLSAIESRSVKLFHHFCRPPIQYPCFFSESYFCYCSSRVFNRSEYISFVQRSTACGHCLNQGYCIQGDLQNKSHFDCACPKCTTGRLCQFSASHFSISLELLVEATGWSACRHVGPTVLVTIGAIFNGIRITTFAEPKARQIGTGLYLLLNTIISQLALVVLFSRVLYLYVARRAGIEHGFSQGLCKSLPYLMVSLSHTSS